MKKCPKCGNSYTDKTLSFCLTDGAVLEEAEPSKTEAFSVSDTGEQTAEITKDNARLKINVADSEPATAEAVSGKSGGGFSVKVIVAIIVALLFLTALTSAVAVYLFFISSNGTSGISKAENRSDNSDPEVAELKEKIEELTNRIESNAGEENQTGPVPVTTPESAPEFDEEVIQRVNSPSDGFLALRDRPSASSGNRLAKIPHGDIVVMERCQEKTETIGGRTGRWCYVRWEGKAGWVFDVWLTD